MYLHVDTGICLGFKHILTVFMVGAYTLKIHFGFVILCNVHVNPH